MPQNGQTHRKISLAASNELSESVLSQYIGEHGGFKMLSKNTCEGVHLIIKLPAISLQAYKFTKNEFLHTYFSRMLARF